MMIRGLEGMENTRTFSNMKHVTALGQVLEEIEALVGKMGGFIDSGMEVSYALFGPGTNDGVISANPKLVFDLAKLYEYIAQSRQQASGNGQ